MHSFSQEAQERPQRTVQAAGILRENAGVIWQVAAAAQEDEVVVAVVQHDLTFGGAWAVARANLLDEVRLLEDQGGWSLLFSSRSPVAQIEKRCKEFASIATRRRDAMQRYLSRQKPEA